MGPLESAILEYKENFNEFWDKYARNKAIAATNNELDLFIDIAGKNYQTKDYLMSKECDELWEDEQSAAPDVWEDRGEWAASQEREAYDSGEPSVHFDTAKELPPDTWLIHFTDANPYDIIRTGFKGRDLDILGLTTHYKQGSRSGDLALAFEYDELGREPSKYGKNAVMFQVKESAKAWHWGDEEYQVIFPVEAAHNLHGLFRSDEEGDGWLELRDDEGDVVMNRRLDDLGDFVKHFEKSKKKKTKKNAAAEVNQMINWQKPKLEDELGEYFENLYTKDFFRKKGLKFSNEDELLGVLEKGNLVPITKEELKSSYTNLTLNTSEFKEELKDPEYKASYENMEEALKKNKNLSLPAPIIFKFDDMYYGFAGNRRTNLAFNHNLPLKVWLVEFKTKHKKRPVSQDVEIRETEGRIPIEELIGTRKSTAGLKVIEALTKIVALRNRDNDPAKSEAAVVYLKKIQSEIPTAIKEFEDGVKKKDRARALCYDLANVVMDDWFRYYFK